MLLSSLRLFTDEEFCTSFIHNDKTITFFQDFYVNDELTLFYVTYKLHEDGYFQETEVINMEKSEVVFMGKIEDKDGYSNVRKKTSLKSDILYTVSDGMVVYVKEIPDADFYEILLYYDGAKGFQSRDFHTEGYIHKSRVIRETSQ
jgi:hypothetical protein